MPLVNKRAKYLVFILEIGVYSRFSHRISDGSGACFTLRLESDPSTCTNLLRQHLLVIKYLGCTYEFLASMVLNTIYAFAIGRSSNLFSSAVFISNFSSSIESFLILSLSAGLLKERCLLISVCILYLCLYFSSFPLYFRARLISDIFSFSEK